MRASFGEGIIAWEGIDREYHLQRRGRDGKRSQEGSVLLLEGKGFPFFCASLDFPTTPLQLAASVSPVLRTPYHTRWCKSVLASSRASLHIPALLTSGSRMRVQIMPQSTRTSCRVTSPPIRPRSPSLNERMNVHSRDRTLVCIFIQKVVLPGHQPRFDNMRRAKIITVVISRGEMNRKYEVGQKNRFVKTMHQLQFGQENLSSLFTPISAGSTPATTLPA